MDNNDILRQLRYTFNFSDHQMADVFKQAALSVKIEQIVTWLKPEEDTMFTPISDKELATFLNGLIKLKRGEKDGPPFPPEEVLNNNIIFRKLKIALSLKDTDIVDLFKSVDLKVGKHEINALFRNPKQAQYRECKDQFLRNFLFGLKRKFRENL